MDNDLHDFVHGLVLPTKIAATDLDHLSIEQLEALIVLPEAEKVAYLSRCLAEGTGGDAWLDQFCDSPLHAKAVQLCEQELALEQQELQQRLKRRAEREKMEAQMESEDDIWTKKDILRLQKAQLALELHKAMKGQGGGKDPTMKPQPTEQVMPASEEGDKTAEANGADIQTVGQINNGDPQDPSWPRSTLGLDSAGRRATPEEEAEQKQTGLAANPATPDASFHNPEHGTKSATLLDAVKQAAPNPGTGMKALAAEAAMMGAPVAAAGYGLKKLKEHREKKAGDLTEKKRDSLKGGQFALPAQRKFPIPDEAHARNALARAAQFGSPEVQAKVRAAVHRKFPGVKETDASKPSEPTVKETISKTSSLLSAVREGRPGPF